MAIRAEQMSADDYQELVASRAVSLLHKGQKAFSRWIGLNTDLKKDKVVIEMVAAIAKWTFRNIVESAIRARSPQNKLHIISTPLTVLELSSRADSQIIRLQEMLKAVAKVKGGYMLFYKDMSKGEDSDTEKLKIVIEKPKRSVVIIIQKDITPEEIDYHWNDLSESSKNDYKLRLVAEKSIKNYFKSRKDQEDYIPVNEYAAFIKETIEKQGITKCNSHFFYNCFLEWQKLQTKERKRFVKEVGKSKAESV